MGGTVKLSDLGKWPKTLISRYHSEIVQAIRLTVQMQAPKLIQWSIAATKPYQPVNTGDYKRNWKSRNIPDGVQFYNPTVQAGIIERGRRPGFGVSKDGRAAIARWVHLHGMDQLTKGTKMRFAAAGIASRAAMAKFRRDTIATDEEFEKGVLARAMKRVGGQAATAAVDKRARVQRRRWLQGNRAEGIAFLIARKIKQQGLPAKYVFGNIEPMLKDYVFNAVSDTILKGPP